MSRAKSIGSERRIDGAGGKGEQQHVTVGRRVHHRSHGNVGAAAGSVLDIDRLSDLFRQTLGEDARRNIDGASSQ
jgi:hypothetical protein